MIHPLRLSVLCAGLILAATAPAQFRKTQLPAVGIELRVSSTLKLLPLRLDASDPYLRVRFTPVDGRRGEIKTREGEVRLSAAVLEFETVANPTTGARSEEEKGDTEKGDEELSPLQRMLKKMRGNARRSGVRSFADWTKRGWRGVEFTNKGKLEEGRGKQLPYKFWDGIMTRNSILRPSARNPRGGSTRRRIYVAASVYTLGPREVAVVVSVPLPKGDSPRGRLGQTIDRMLASAELLKDGEGEIGDSKRRDKHADTPERQKALEAAKRNIEGSRNWSYFTTENYIVLYSWDPGQRSGSENFSRRLAKGLERMRKLYMEYYPMREDMKMPYSVFRVCATYSQFQKYGGSPPGVVGWFSPRSKELVVFQGGDSRMRKRGYVETVTYHEGWHQYCNAYFNGAEVHRWFDEGHGDFFGAHLPGGRYIGSDMRYKWVKLMVNKGDFVPFKDIVRWPRSRFYGNPRTAYFYAQAFGMIDFLRFGHRMGKRDFDPAWSGILETYRKTMLETKDCKKATEAAFKGVDYAAMEAAWKKYVDSPRFRKPR